MKKVLSVAIALGLLMQSAAGLTEAAPPAEALSAAEATAETEKVQNKIPAEVPETEQTIEPTIEASVEPTIEASIEASVEPSIEPTIEATTEPDAEPTIEPSMEPTQVPAEEAAEGIVRVSSRDEMPEGAQAWVREDGMYLCGSLAEIIGWAREGAEVYVRRADTMKIKSVSLRKLAGLKLLADEKTFAGGEYRVFISKDDPAVTEVPTELDLTQWLAPAEDEEMDVFVWTVRKVPEGTPVPTREPDEVKIGVSSDDCRPGEWSSVHPVFLLSGIPEGKSWAYAAVIFDERIAVLSGDCYAAEEEGVYTVRFVMLDEMGDIVDASEKYTLWLDHTLPEVMVSMDDTIDYTMHIDMADSMSGLQGLTLDGGESWIELNGRESDRYTVSGKMRIAAGMLQVCDAAGNLWVSTEDYEPAKLPSGGSSGGSSGSSTPVKQHAAENSGDDDSGAEYNALAMKLPDGPMHVLTIDGQEMELTLELASAEGFEIPEGYAPSFTAELKVWTAEKAAGDVGDEHGQPDEADQKLDTLVLTAVTEENIGDRFEYRWKFNGGVYRLLANSGVRYLALEIDGEMAVFPTEGFVGGTKYTQLKMLGVSTRRFDYTAAMRFDLDPNRIPKLSASDRSEKCDLAILTEVDNERYVLSDEQKGEMYYCNVYLGPAEMMEAPYGAYGA